MRGLFGSPSPYQSPMTALEASTYLSRAAWCAAQASSLGFSSPGAEIEFTFWPRRLFVGAVRLAVHVAHQVVRPGARGNKPGQ